MAFRKKRFSRKKKTLRRRRGRFRRRGRRGSSRSQMNKWLWHSVCTPQVVKQTTALGKSGIQSQRQWWSMPLATLTDLKEMLARRPAKFFATGTTTEFGANTGKLGVSKLFKQFLVQNRSNTNMHLKIYYCFARKDITTTQYAITDTAAQTVFASDDTTAFNQGPGQPANPVGVSAKHQYPAYTPFMSSDFCSLFKVYKTKSLVLQPNGYTSLSCKQRPKEFRIEYLLDTGTPEWQRGWSKLLLFSWVGQPIDAGDIAEGHLGLSKCDLQITQHLDYRFHFKPVAQPLYKIDAPTTTIGGVIGGDQTSYYAVNPAAFTALVPPNAVIETVVGTAGAGADVPEVR